jgi:hypothetical protein
MQTNPALAAPVKKNKAPAALFPRPALPDAPNPFLQTILLGVRLEALRWLVEEWILLPQK